MGGCMNWAYVAGFFDGEGTLGSCGIRGQKGGARIFCRIYQQNIVVLERIQHFLEDHGIASTIVRPVRTGFAGRQQYGLNIRLTTIEKFLVGVRPYVIVKKQLVEDCWRYLKVFPTMTPKMRGWLAGETRWAASA